MAFIRIHKLTTGSVAAAGEKEDTYTSEAEYTLKEILVTEQGADTLENVQLYADVGGKPMFRPDIPAALLKPSNPERPQLNLPFGKGQKFNYKLTNGTAAAVTCDICLVLETEAWPPA